MSDLPPLDQPQAFVVVGPDDQRGPYTLELLISEVVAGRLHDATPVWWSGLPDWTTMTAHPGLAAEIQRRRSPAPQAAAPFAPPPAAQPASPPVAEQPAPSAFQPEQPAQPAPGQYQEMDYGYGQSAGGFVAASSPGQDFSTEMYAGNQATPVEPAIDPTPPEEPQAPVTPVDQTVAQAGEPAEAQDAIELSGENVAAEVGGGDDADVYISDTGVVMDVEPVDLTVADFEAVDGPAAGEEGYRAAGDAMGLDPGHGEAFAALVARSRARAEAAAVVDSVDDEFADSVESAAVEMGLEVIERSDDESAHLYSFRSATGDTWNVRLGRVTGAQVGLRDGDVTLDASCRADVGGAVVATGGGDHGDIVVVAEEFSGASTATVSLLLAVQDYVGEDFTVDRAALERDLRAVVANVRATLG